MCFKVKIRDINHKYIVVERMKQSMGNENKFFREKMEQEYPKMANEFKDMIKTKISEQIGEKQADLICVELPHKTRRKKTLQLPLKWVAAAAILLICGTTAAAAANPELKNYLLERLKGEDVDTYMQNVEPKIKENTGDNDILDKLDLSLEEPLWEITNAWYDGVTLYFVASPSEKAKEISDQYEMYPSSHCIVNGQDTLLQCPDAERLEGELSEGEKTGQYHLQIDLGGKGISGNMDVSFKLRIHERSEEIITQEPPSQEIQFHVDEAASAVKVVENGYEKVELPDGKAELLKFALAPSGLYTEVKYTFYGEDAKERAEQISGCYYIEDSFGERIDGQWPVIANPQDIVKEADGGYSIILEWETKGVNADTESVKFLPYIFTETDSDGKAVPGSEQVLDWAVFTVPVVAVK